MRIAVVDDSRLMRTFVRVHLQSAGHHVVEVEPSSTYEVLRQLREDRPDLLVADYEMPCCNGETLIRFIREDPVLAGTRVLVVSAHSEADLVERLSRQALCGYLVKPITPESLTRAVEDIVQEASAAAQPEGPPA
jgi:CheY-like chemotaxis protein